MKELDNTLEQKVTQGKSTYFHCLGYDAHRGHLVLLLVTLPDLDTVARTVVFRGVREFSDDWFDEVVGDNDLELLIGLDAYPEEHQTRYVIVTDSREIGFVTRLEPEILEG